MARLETVYGTIESAYEIKDKLKIDVSIPENTTAEIILPDGQFYTVGSGKYEYFVSAEKFSTEQIFTFDSKISDLLNNAEALKIARELVPQMFEGEQGKLLAVLPLSLGQLGNMSDKRTADILKGLLIEINERLGGTK